jgi:hypothetical protein
MSASRGAFWVLWAVFVVCLGLELLLAERVPVRAIPWHAGQTAVAGFVVALIGIALGVWTFALRESLALRDVRAGRIDLRTAEGLARMRSMLLALWSLCLLIGLLGLLMAWGAASPAAAWPYVFGAGVLLAMHAPRERHFHSRGVPAVGV